MQQTGKLQDLKINLNFPSQNWKLKNISLIDRKPSSETASFKSSAYPTVENDSYTQMPYVEITNTGAPVTGINPNWEAFNLWTQVEQKIDKIKKLSCNRKYH